MASAAQRIKCHATSGRKESNLGLIDRYVFATFLRVFLICFAGLFGMYVVGDFVNNLNEFLDPRVSANGLLSALIRYYGPCLPWFFDITAGIAALVASVFTVTWLQRYSEMTALMAAGITRWRIVRPLIVATVLVSGAAAANREWGMPRFGDSLSRNIQDLVGNRKQRLHPARDRLTQVTLAGEEVLLSEQRIVAPRFELPPHFGSWTGQLKARFAEALPATNDHPAGYLLQEVAWPDGVVPSTDVQWGEAVVLFTPSAHAWLTRDQCFLASNVPLTQLAGESSANRFASTGQILRELHNASVDVGRDAVVTLHARFVQPLLDMALSFAGLGIILHRIARNVFVASGYAMLLVAVHFGVTLASHSLGVGFLISAAFAAWLPVMIMIPLAFWLSTSLSR
ncbi:MAG: LptF/LptG family permease [Planctomycetota bacterium]|nr:LptF/LptG family permease [Planctomycetota bacterium]MDA1179798.1 LptF/LptG family permease [Planctomycetota bacterium]